MDEQNPLEVPCTVVSSTTRGCCIYAVICDVEVNGVPTRLHVAGACHRAEGQPEWQLWQLDAPRAGAMRPFHLFEDQWNDAVGGGPIDQTQVFAHKNRLVVLGGAWLWDQGLIGYEVNLDSGRTQLLASAAERALLPPGIYIASACVLDVPGVGPQGFLYGGAAHDTSVSGALFTFPMGPVQRVEGTVTRLAPPVALGLRRIDPEEGAVWPQPRLYHSVCAVRDVRMYVFGGAPDCKNTVEGDKVYGDLWYLDALEESWHEVTPTSSRSPSPRGSATMHFMEPHIYMYGGFDGARGIPELWRFNVDTAAWEELALPAVARETCGSWAHCSAMSPDGTLTVFGGVRYATGPAAFDRSLWTDRVAQLKVPISRTLKQCVAEYVGARVGDFAVELGEAE